MMCADTGVESCALCTCCYVWCRLSEWVLFLDADEVVNASAFRHWFERSGDVESYDAIDFQAAYYVDTPRTVAYELRDIFGLLIRSAVVTPGQLLFSRER